MKKLLMFIFMLLHCSIQGQNLLENLSLTEKNMGDMDSTIKTFIESLHDTIYVEDRYCYVNIFHFSEERSNYLSLNDIIDTASFSKDYFVNGYFITDFINKNNALGKNYINVFKTVIYDRLLEQSFYFNYNNYKTLAGNIDPNSLTLYYPYYYFYNYYN